MLYGNFARAQPLLARFQEIKPLRERRYRDWEQQHDQLAKLADGREVQVRLQQMTPVTPTDFNGGPAHAVRASWD